MHKMREVFTTFYQTSRLNDAHMRLHDVRKAIFGSDNDLLPVRHQTIIWNNAGLLSTGQLWANFSEIGLKIKFLFTKMYWEISSAKMASILSRPQLTQRIYAQNFSNPSPGFIYRYPSKSFRWHGGNREIASEPLKQRCPICVIESLEPTGPDHITTLKQSTTKPWVYFVGYTARHFTRYQYMRFKRETSRWAQIAFGALIRSDITFFGP